MAKRKKAGPKGGLVKPSRPGHAAKKEVDREHREQHTPSAKEVDIAGQRLVEGSLVDEMAKQPWMSATRGARDFLPEPAIGLPERPQLLRDMDLGDGIVRPGSLTDDEVETAMGPLVTRLPADHGAKFPPDDRPGLPAEVARSLVDSAMGPNPGHNPAMHPKVRVVRQEPGETAAEYNARWLAIVERGINEYGIDWEDEISFGVTARNQISISNKSGNTYDFTAADGTDGVAWWVDCWNKFVKASETTKLPVTAGNLMSYLEANAIHDRETALGVPIEDVRAYDTRTGKVLTKSGQIIHPRSHPAAARAKRIGSDVLLAYNVYQEILRTLADRQRAKNDAMMIWELCTGEADITSDWAETYYGKPYKDLPYPIILLEDEGKYDGQAQTVEINDKLSASFTDMIARQYTEMSRSLMDTPPVWVTETMFDLALGEAHRISDDMITNRLAPSRAGCVLFPRPHDVMGIECSAVLWILSSVSIPGNTSAPYRPSLFAPGADEGAGPPMNRSAFDSSITFVLFTTDGEPHLLPLVETDDLSAYQPPLMQFLREVISIWTLCVSKLVERGRGTVPRPVMRRLGREFPRHSAIEVITLRKRQGPTRPRTEGEGGGVDWQFQWPVHPHPHKYWVKDKETGEKHVEVRWLDLYVKGPADKPMKQNPAIYKLER